jgi:hypothetical protein
VPLAQGSDDGALPGKTNLHIVLGSGTYGAPCSTAAGSSPCGGGLECKKYSTSETGVCTHPCATAACEPTTPAAVCAAFPGTSTLYCQWDCTSSGPVSGPCPLGLTCKAAANSGGKSYCTGL